MLHEETVGTCTLEEMGLYWIIQCRCKVLSDKVERLYAGERKLGVLEKEGEQLTLRRRLSKSSCPELPPVLGYLTLHPTAPKMPQTEEKTEYAPWEGSIQGYELKGLLDGDHVLFPYEENAPCPCEPLFCFFEIRDGYWRLPLDV